MTRNVCSVSVALLTGLSVMAAASADPSWNRATPGAKAFVAAEEGDVPAARICPTIPTYRQHLHDGAEASCKSVRQGTPVIVLATARATGDFGVYGRDLILASVRAADRSINGYIVLELLNPAIPNGIDVTLKHDTGDVDLRLAPLQDDGSETRLALASRTRARVISYDPTSADGRDLRVRVISGRHVGKTGWVYARTAFLSDGEPILRFTP
jgi:hypothetical protein